MNRSVYVASIALVMSACTEAAPTEVIPVFETTPEMIVLDGHAHGGAIVGLSGDEEVPARVTSARGASVIHFNKRRNELSYVLVVSEIHNVVQAHIHIGAAGTNGPIAVFLYGLVPAGGGPVKGVLAKGTLTDEDLAGQPAGLTTLAELWAQIQAGNAYVNVHTNDGVAPTNTGPGDFPGGEIRGQLD
jgi:hypothetical protein